MTARTPSRKARITGADTRNPARFAGRNSPASAPIGDPSQTLKDDERQAWQAFAAELPWLSYSHRALLEIASILRAKVEAGIDGINHIQVYSAILSKLGATPADESRIGWQAEDESDESDRYFN